MRAGINVLLSDVDVAILADPFGYLYRDADWEGMTDGFDDPTAYGYDHVHDDPAMGWSRYAHSMRVFVQNSGFFYLSATLPSAALMARMKRRMATEDVWDQQAVNEEIFRPSHDAYLSPMVSVRVMNFRCFCNSKVLFKVVRHDRAYKHHLPPVVHINYHPSKNERLKDVFRYYHFGKKDALQKWKDGEGRRK